jgi:NADPH:quinone reductase-like Zn-dependent oxidoreductase
MEKKILVTAAGGNQGKILVPKAAKAGFTVRAMRRSKCADELLAIGASDVVIGDASNPNDVAMKRRSYSFVSTHPVSSCSSRRTCRPLAES